MIAWLKELLAPHAVGGTQGRNGPSGSHGEGSREARVLPPLPHAGEGWGEGAGRSAGSGRPSPQPSPRGRGSNTSERAGHPSSAGPSSPAGQGSAPRVRAEQGETLAKQLALVIDLNVCVGCHACVTSCKQWNTSGSAGPLADENAYDAHPTGTFFNRVQTYEAGVFPGTETIHFPKSCLHCEEPPCVPVCPTGASYKRKDDGIVLVDYDKCIGCGYCAWACPYGMRELDEERAVMTKCTLCVDRIYNETLPESDRRPACVMACPTGARLFGDVKDPESDVSKAIRERGGYALMPEWETQPANQYLPRRITTPALQGTPASTAQHRAQKSAGVPGADDDVGIGTQ